MVLDKSLEKDKIKRQHFVDFMKTMFGNGHAEKTPALKVEECWYLPMFQYICHVRKLFMYESMFK